MGRIILGGWLALAFVHLAPGADSLPRGHRWNDFAETNFPFFSSVLDVRKLPAPGEVGNLTPRGLVLNLGRDCWACFDLDLLRVSALWTGRGVTPVSMAQGSYHLAGVKSPEGQRALPEIDGRAWLVNGIYPGWQAEDTFSLKDPRPATPDAREVGRGPLPSEMGRFSGLRILDDHTVLLEYRIHGVEVSEWMTAQGGEEVISIQRSFVLRPVARPLVLALGRRVKDVPLAWSISTNLLVEGVEQPDGLLLARVRPATNSVSFQVAFALNRKPSVRERPHPAQPRSRWPEILTTRAVKAGGAHGQAYVIDDVPIPSVNPWRRNVRLTDLAFDRTGNAAAVTFDGDIWKITGLQDDLMEVRWRRFASGFHEPMGIAFRNGQLFVNDRGGIWRLHDDDADGEADAFELFSNIYAQTAETREFATGFRVAPDGSFIVAKGGQQTSTIGKDNGTVLRVAPDGKSYVTLGSGLREPFIGVHPRTGLVTASDQQGNYVPATPLHIIQNQQFYGFISLLLPKEKYPGPIADAVTWIPHAVNASGASQVWLTDARMGPLNDAMIHLGYFRPELFVVRWNEREARPQAAVTSLTRDLTFAPLNAAVNPADGQLYVIGMQIWGTIAKEISGLARLRYTGAPNVLPQEVVPMEEGILVRFDVPLEAKAATNVASYSVERWNYQRSANYGSPHFKLDGSKGQETLLPSSAYLARDGKSVFIAVHDLRPVMQMRLGWSLATRAGKVFAASTYFTPHQLSPFSAGKEGFAPVRIELGRPPVATIPKELAPPTAEEGARVAELMGCVACHSTDGSTIGKVGPTWKGLFQSSRAIAGQGKVVADEVYLRESIREPTAKVLAGFEKGDVGMPSYDGVLTDHQIESLVLYLKTLRNP